MFLTVLEVPSDPFSCTRRSLEEGALLCIFRIKGAIFLEWQLYFFNGGISILDGSINGFRGVGLLIGRFLLNLRADVLIAAVAAFTRGGLSRHHQVRNIVVFCG